MENITKVLKIGLVLLIITGMITSMIYFINKEESEAPRYSIRTEHEYYKTDTFNIDSNNCINFIAIESRPFNSPKTRAVQICGGHYVIEEKWKK